MHFLCPLKKKILRRVQSRGCHVGTFPSFFLEKPSQLPGGNASHDPTPLQADRVDRALQNIAHIFCRSCRFVVVPMITAPAWGRWLASQKKNDVKSRIRKYDLYPKGENRDEAIFHLPWKHLCKSIFVGEIQECRSLGASFNAKLLLAASAHITVL